MAESAGEAADCALTQSPRSLADQSRSRDSRTFALLWAAYLMAVTGLTAYRAGSMSGMGVEGVRATGRMLLACAAGGMAALWPMVRLSQAPPDKPRAVAVADVISILAPTQAILWTMHFVVAWGWRASLATGALLTSWGVLIAGVVLWGQMPGRGPRALWMAACLGLALVGPGAWVAFGLVSGHPGMEAALLGSPISGVYAITATAGGAPAQVGAAALVAALAPGVIGGCLWRAARDDKK